MTRILYIGNAKHPFCTEVHLARALRDDLGCEVAIYQQESAVAAGPDAFVDAALGRDSHAWNDLTPARADLTLYSRTHNNLALGQSWLGAWERLKRAGIVTASFHLDRFFDLEREHLVWDHDPLFATQHVFTADGGSDARFAAAGVNHHWLPPGVDRVEAEQPGRADPHFPYDVIFVGSGGSYHGEYPQRQELLDHLQRTYRNRFARYGVGGDRPVVRQQALNDALCSAKVVVGDSCFANEKGSPRSRAYASDRVPESLGRGGFLIHPYVPNLVGNADYLSGVHLATHAPGDWDDLDAQIGYYLANPGLREGIAEQGRAHVLANHTYSHRARAILETCGLPIPVDEREPVA